MQKKYITIGGGKFKLNGHSPVEFNFDRLKLLKKYNNVKLNTIFNKPNAEINIDNVHDLIKTVVIHWKLNMAYVHSAGFLHEVICKKYMDIITKSGLPYNSSDEKKPGNYTGACVELSVMSWDGYSGGKVKGFCPCEPDVRLKQLADFPIEHFNNGNEILITEVEVPVKPNIIEVQIDPNDIISTLQKIKPQLYQWEKYYIEMTNVIEKINRDLISC